MAYEMVSLLRMLIDREGSDLHLAVDNPPCARVHGNIIHFGIANLTPEDRASVSTAIRDGLASHEAFTVAFDVSTEKRAVAACCLRAAPIFSGEEFIGLAGTVEDMTERSQIELASEQARLQAEGANHD